MKIQSVKNKKEIIEKFLAFNIDEEDIEFEERIINSDIVQVIKSLMKENKCNQETLAEKLGISPPHISKLFSGEKKINLNILAKIQIIFDVRFKIKIKEDLIEVSRTRAVLESNIKEIVQGFSNEVGESHDVKEDRIISSKIVDEAPQKIQELAYS